MATKNTATTTPIDDTAKYYLYSDGTYYYGLNTRYKGEFGVKVEKDKLSGTTDDRINLYNDLMKAKEEAAKKAEKENK